jgi:hypothetical protein
LHRHQEGTCPSRAHTSEVCGEQPKQVTRPQEVNLSQRPPEVTRLPGTHFSQRPQEVTRPPANRSQRPQKVARPPGAHFTEVAVHQPLEATWPPEISEAVATLLRLTTSSIRYGS